MFATALSIMRKINANLDRMSAVFGFFLGFFGLIFLYIIIPFMNNRRISKMIPLQIGSPMRRSWSELQVQELHSYVFNITNPDEIVNGEKPIIKEVGPYVFDVWQERIKMVDHEEDDTLSYTLKMAYFFNATKSEPLTEEKELVLPENMILGLVNTKIRTKPDLMPNVSKSVDSIWNTPKNFFAKQNIIDYLFRGNIMNCIGVEEYFAKIVCNELKKLWHYYRITKYRDDVYGFSTLATFNDTVLWTRRTRINRGIKNIADIGKVVRYNNTNNFGTWDDEKCDEFVGTDGTMFPPFLSRSDNLHVVQTWTSRSLTYKYESDISYGGFDCYRYVATLGAELETNPDDKCYCLSSDQCLKNGVFEGWKVIHWPLVGSNPHFCMADPYYIERVSGLNPDPKKHLSIIDVHPLTGIVVGAKFRLQWSAPLTKHPMFRLFENVSEALLPIGWTEERYYLPPPEMECLKKLSFKIVVEKFLAYHIIAIGFGLLCMGILFDVLKRKKPK